MSISSFELRRPVAYRTLIEALEAAPLDRPFVTMWNDEDDSESVTFGQFKQQAESLAVYFQSNGLGASDTVVLIMPQGIELMAAFAGAMILGAVPAILAYPNFKVEPAKYRAGLAGVTANLKARMVVLDDKFPEELMDYVAVGSDTLVLRSAAGQESSVYTELFRPSLEADSLAFIQRRDEGATVRRIEAAVTTIGRNDELGFR
ncbi:MAG TPA: AMP-binding protein, partial [Blastocatellia bacterium]|nr:AMP-binding protein [Blastocatellia bacterium]